jgi:hypothetical protein
VPFNLLLRDFAERAWQARAAGRLAPRDPPAQARAVRLLADRPRPRVARRRDRARAARAAPGLEIDWLAQDPSPRCSSAAASGSTREPLLAQRVAPHRSRGARARAARLPGVAADGRDPARQLHGLPRRRRDEPYDLWIGDEAWELDYYLHENPELKRAAYAS